MLFAAAIGLFALGVVTLGFFALLLRDLHGTLAASLPLFSLNELSGVGAAALAAALASVGVAALAWGGVLIMRARERAQYRVRMDTAAYNARLEVRNRLLEQQTATVEKRLEDLRKQVREIEERDIVTIPEPAPATFKEKMHFPRVPEDTTLEDVRKPAGGRPAAEETPAPRRAKQPFPRLPDDVAVLPDADDPVRKNRKSTRRRRA